MKQKREIQVYVDATCDSWQKTNGSANGEIIIKTGRKVIRQKFTLEDPTLKQFINRFEFEAIMRARNLYSTALILSDSQVAVGWAKYARDENVKWIPRDQNKAGHVLEKERPKKDKSFYIKRYYESLKKI